MFKKFLSKNKQYLFMILVFVIFICLIISLFIKKTRGAIINNLYNIVVESCSNSNNTDGRCLIEGELVSNKFEDVSDITLNYMRYNTETLQNLYDEASSLGVANDAIVTISLPSGVYYFISGGYNNSRYNSSSRKVENIVINLKNNVRLIGAGIDEEGINTTLKPYSKLQDSSISASSCYDDYENCVYHGLDMFYFNDYRDYDQNYGEGTYLENVFFEDFIIDGFNVNEVNYSSAGKGFMINLCKNCHWNRIVVENTAATGFGMDNVINGSITNSKAINNGRRAKEWVELHPEVDLRDIGGNSGFGVGTGYSNDESMYIANCESIGNAKYGYFFEHQNRFNKTYKAIKAQGFVVVNSSSNNNMFNYGGERANDVAFINSTSIHGDDTIDDIMFKSQSRRVYSINLELSTRFSDVEDSNYYSAAAYWALANGIITDDNSVLSNDIRFNGNDFVTRSSALMMLWRMTGMQGNVLYYSSTLAEGSDKCGIGGLDKSSSRKLCIETGFNDVEVDADYANAIRWGLDNNIVRGSSGNTFNPDGIITTNALVYFLYRYNNGFVGETAEDSEALSWANSVGLLNNIVDTSNHELTKAEVVQILYNYSNANGVNFPIYYLLMGDDTNTVQNDNVNYYTSGESLSLLGVEKNGYNFVGWIGSNGTNPENVSISSTDRGNKVYVANYKDYSYKVYYNGNGATGQNYNKGDDCNDNACGLDRYEIGSIYNVDNDTFESNRQWLFNNSYKLIENKFFKIGYKFAGWSDTPSGSVKYLQSEEVYNLTDTKDGIVVLYAVWEPNKIKIQYDMNGGKLIDPHGSAYGNNETLITKNGNTIFHELEFNGVTDTNGLRDYNNASYINIGKDGYIAKENKEWYKIDNDEKVFFSQSGAILANDLCDASYGDCTVTLFVNWEKNRNKITFDSNEGQLDGSNELYVESDSAITYISKSGSEIGQLPVGNKEGYLFNGWWTAKTDGILIINTNGSLVSDTIDGYIKNGTWNIENDISLYAQYIENYNLFHDLTYNCSENGGYFDELNNNFKSNYKIGSSVDLSIKCKKNGYDFLGWNTDKNATNKIDSYIMPENNSTIYAIFKKEAVTLKARFNGNEGTLSNNEDKTCTIKEVYNNNEQATTCMVDVPTFSKTGYTLIGWNINNESSENNSAYNVSTNKLTLNVNDDTGNGRIWYAISKANRYMITFNAVTGILSGSDMLYVEYNSDKIYQTEFDDEFGVIPTVTREGYGLTGWYTASGDKVFNVDGSLNPSVSGYTSNDGKFVINDNIVLYAHFESVQDNPFVDTFEFNEKANYDVDNEILAHIAPGVDSVGLFNTIDTNGVLGIFNKDGTQLIENIKLRTGYKLRATFTTKVLEYKISVKGDVLGTGELSSDNAKEIAKHVIKKNTIVGEEYLLAADYNNDGKIKMNDVVKILQDKKKLENS